MFQITNAIIYDGTGAKPFHGSVHVSEKEITKVSPDPSGFGSKIQTIDAKGKALTPGFIDIHRHADAAVFRLGFGEIELKQGITSIINGNCGMSIAPAPSMYWSSIHSYMKPITGSVPETLPCDTFASYLAALSNQPLPLNVGCCVGNGTCRMAVTGFNSAPLSSSEKKLIQEQLYQSLQSGALGVTMGLAYVPENNYSFEELVEVLQPMKDFSVPLSTHIRGEGDLLVSSIREVAQLASTLQVPLNVSHFKAVGSQNWGAHLQEATNILDELRETGLRVTMDVYPYTAGSSQLAQLLPPWVQEGGTDAAIQRLSSPETRNRITEELSHPTTGYENILLSIGWDAILLTGLQTPKNQPYIGRTIGELAREQEINPYELAYNLLVEEAFNVSMVDFIMDEQDVIHVMQNPHTSIISDSLYSDSGKPHPRLYGAFPEFISKYVLNKKILPLETAIQKMTSFPASVYGLNSKGIIAEGYDADLCLFSPDNVSTSATYSDPQHLAMGMEYVWVRGVPVIENGIFTDNRPGVVLKSV